MPHALDKCPLPVLSTLWATGGGHFPYALGLPTPCVPPPIGCSSYFLSRVWPLADARCLPVGAAQGEMIDRVEKNILDSEDYVHKGHQHLAAARESQHKARKVPGRLGSWGRGAWVPGEGAWMPGLPGGGASPAI